MSLIHGTSHGEHYEFQTTQQILAAPIPSKNPIWQNYVFFFLSNCAIHTHSQTCLPSKPPDVKAGFSPEATGQERVTDQSAILLQVFYIP